MCLVLTKQHTFCYRKLLFVFANKTDLFLTTQMYGTTPSSITAVAEPGSTSASRITSPRRSTGEQDGRLCCPLVSVNYYSCSLTILMQAAEQLKDAQVRIIPKGKGLKANSNFLPQGCVPQMPNFPRAPPLIPILRCLFGLPSIAPGLKSVISLVVAGTRGGL